MIATLRRRRALAMGLAIVQPPPDPHAATRRLAEIVRETSLSGILRQVFLLRLSQLPPDRTQPHHIEHPIKYSGKSSEEKIREISINFQEDFLILTQPDSICWLLNIRGEDVPFCPVTLCYAFIDKKLNITIFHKYKLTNFPKLQNVSFVHISKLEKFADEIREKHISLDKTEVPYWFILKFKNIKDTKNPCLLPKACKNKIEVKGSVNAHIIDGLAVIKFLHFIENNPPITEITAAEKIHALRKQHPLFKIPSFATIAGYGNHGAIIHYHANEQSNALIAKSNLFLLDSGGQYLSGTTDITRTIHLGRPSREHIKFYTLVLKGHVNLAKAIFPEGSTGSQLDILARLPLWENSVDFGHGTGHGVGSYLNVHEGPQRIGKGSNVPLREGMILSNEPGYYLPGKFGIRIENLMVVEKHNKDFLRFKTLTMVPYEKKLIDTTLISEEEINWINLYHQKILAVYAKYITDKSLKTWLEDKCSPLHLE